ncbi:MAG: hypothetical protein PHU75_05680 [Candidatus Nanopelagicales bacterium]|nr:hypothetical protein [Candidatus Nanopelagicales bacterium]
MTTLHIGAAGELLVQYHLLKNEVDSARLTTDSGIDLVAYSAGNEKARTIQVKTVRVPGHAGGNKRAPLAIGLRFPETCPAELIALALLSTNEVWLFTTNQARKMAQQHSDSGFCQLYWYLDPETAPRGARHQGDMDRYRLENCFERHFPLPDN